MPFRMHEKFILKDFPLSSTTSSLGGLNGISRNGPISYINPKEKSYGITNRIGGVLVRKGEPSDNQGDSTKGKVFKFVCPGCKLIRRVCSIIL